MIKFLMNKICETYSAYSSIIFRESKKKSSNHSLLGCDTVKCCSRLLTFWRNLLPPFSGWSEAGKKRSINIGLDGKRGEGRVQQWEGV
jgi:hypothetical protein